MKVGPHVRRKAVGRNLDPLLHNEGCSHCRHSEWYVEATDRVSPCKPYRDRRLLLGAVPEDG